MNLRVGTRGSDLALWQTRWVRGLVRRIDASVVIQEVVIATEAERSPDAPLQRGAWPAGGFVGAIERSLVAGEIDFAVHSYKDLPSASPPELTVVAVPERAESHDVLVCARPSPLEGLPRGLRVGASSPRRAAQLSRGIGAEVVPIRGNVPTRLAAIHKPVYDAVCLAAAGLTRLGILPADAVHLPIERYCPAPAQGAVAVQCRRADTSTVGLLSQLEDAQARLCVRAERAFLRRVAATCMTPVAAHATLCHGGSVALTGELFTDDKSRGAKRSGVGQDPEMLGSSVADAVLCALGLDPAR